jgi:hypothetical protein
MPTGGMRLFDFVFSTYSLSIAFGLILQIQDGRIGYNEVIKFLLAQSTAYPVMLGLAGFMSSSPMIEVTNLTKRYAGRTALSGISFSVGKGEIAGLLQWLF